jgi:hypothetical protein
MTADTLPLVYPEQGEWFDRACPWNGWLVSVSVRGKKRRIEGLKEFGGELFTVRLSMRRTDPPVIGLVNAAAMMAAEDARVLGETARADYWMAVHRLLRQDIKTRKGGILVPEELAARDRNMRIFRATAEKAGDDLPFNHMVGKD